MSLVFSVEGEPQGKGRARAFRLKPRPGKKGGGIGHYTPPKTEEYERKIGEAAALVMGDIPPYEGPMKLTLTAFFEIPKSWPKWKQTLARNGQLMPTGKPDLDNVLKAIKDGMNKIVWLDDSQVCAVSAEKIYTPEGQSPCVWVSVRQLEAAPANCDRSAVTP